APPHERPGTWRSAAGRGGRPAARRQLGFAAPQAAHASPMCGGPGGLRLKRGAVVCSRMRGGDPAALASLRGAEHRQMTWHHRLAYRLTGTREDAEDVVHDVFVGLPEALLRYEERGRLESWLKRVAARVALMRLRQRGRRREVPLEAVAGHRSPEAPSDVAALQ